MSSDSTNSTPAAIHVELIALALLLLATCIAYTPALRGDFLWDDNTYVRDNPVLRATDGIRQIWTDPLATPQVHPLVFTTYWLEYQIWGLNPLAYHLVNLALHLCNTILLWRLLTRLALPGALLAAGLFALHPMHVESVAWISERKDVLSVFFYLLGMLAWVRFLDQPKRRTYVALLVFFVLAMCSKTVLCTFPVAALLLAWWREPPACRRAIPAIIPLLILSSGFAVLNIWREYQYGNPALPLSALDRILIAGRAVWFYVFSLLWPLSLTALYPPWPVDHSAAWPYVFPFGVVAVLVALWLARRRIGNGPLVAATFFVLTLSPMLGLVDNNFMRLSWVADHFTYLASCGLGALGAAIVGSSVERAAPSRQWVGWGASALFLAGLAVLTWQQAGIYRDAETFWTDNINKNPQSWMAHNLLAGALARQGRLDEALDHLAAAVRIKPDYATAQNHWGILLDKMGQLDGAREHYAAALAIDPNLPDAHNNLGAVLFRQGQVDAAYEQFAAAVRLKPDYAEAHNHLGLAAAKLGRSDEAVRHFKDALRVKPDYAPAQRNLDQLVPPAGAMREPGRRDRVESAA